MAVAFMRFRRARTHEHGKHHNKGCCPAPTAQCDGRKQRPHERAAQHEKNRNLVDIPARSRIALCRALRGAWRRLNRQRQNVDGVSRRDRENQVRAPALCQPRRRHPVCAVGTLRSFDGTIGGFDFKDCTGHRLVGGEPVEINLEIFAAGNRNDLERVGSGLAAWQRACRHGLLFLVVMAFVGGSGGDRSA
jgi:hypothetical protein